MGAQIHVVDFPENGTVWFSVKQQQQQKKQKNNNKKTKTNKQKKNNNSSLSNKFVFYRHATYQAITIICLLIQCAKP